MVAPIWEKLESIEQHLDGLDVAVNAILKHLNITVPGTRNNASADASSTPEAQGPTTTQVSDEPYEYKPLDFEKAEIRILALNNASDDSDVISGTLVPLSLESPGIKRYNALSYTWGEPKMDRRIIIDGHPLRITQNLESALRQMRKVASKDAGTSKRAPNQTFWWIDQICKYAFSYSARSVTDTFTGINQADIEERGSQVTLMRRIYKNALFVQVWLGEAMEGSALAIDLARKIGRPPVRGPGEKETEYPSFSADEVQQHWQSLQLLLSQPWWKRSWIRQEISLATRTQVYWGEHSVGFDVISQAVMAIEYADSLGHRIPGLVSDGHEATQDENSLKFSFYQQAQSLRALKKGTHQGHSFLIMSDLLRHSRFCDATDQRDKVYSMLGLADPEIYRLRPDYHLSLSEVLKSAARAILPQKKGLRLLGTCQNSERRHGLPSWVPNLVDSWKYRPLEPDDAKHFLSTAESSVEFEEDTMLAKGFIFDTVTMLCEAAVPGNPNIDQIDATYESWQKFCEEATDAGHVDLNGGKPGMRTGIRVQRDMFWLDFLSTDRMASRFLQYSPDDKTTLLSEREEGLKLEYMGLNLKLAQSYLLPASAETKLHPRRRIWAALRKYGPGRRLGICAAKQILVLLPGDALVGDMIVVFRGATFPYILRKVSGDDEAGDRYVVVGECFIPEYALNRVVSMAHAMPSMDAIRVV